MSAQSYLASLGRRARFNLNLTDLVVEAGDDNSNIIYEAAFRMHDDGNTYEDTGVTGSGIQILNELTDYVDLKLLDMNLFEVAALVLASTTPLDLGSAPTDPLIWTQLGNGAVFWKISRQGDGFDFSTLSISIREIAKPANNVSATIQLRVTVGTGPA